MKKEGVSSTTVSRLGLFMGVVCLILSILSVREVFAAQHNYVFIIDTSSSMKSNKLVAPLRVAVDDYADSIPIDGSSQVWIFTFDRGLDRDSFRRDLNGTQDLEDAKVFLNRREFKGRATYVFQALDGVLKKLEAGIVDPSQDDYVIHLFTDGDNNGPRRYSFARNVEAFQRIHARLSGGLELYYHALGVRIPRGMQALIDDTDGIFAVDGIQIPPKAQFNASAESVLDNAPVTFVNSTTGKADTWQWDFGDGAASDEKDPTHVFTEPGTFTVRLTATSGSGTAQTRSTASRKVEVKGGPPNARFEIVDSEKALLTGSMIRFTDRSVGRISKWSWDFGDKSGTSSEKNPEYSFAEEGTFTVKLSLSGEYGEDEGSSYSQVITVSEKGKLAFSVFPTKPTKGQQIRFINESTGQFRDWAWDFGDGSTHREMSPLYTYEEARVYTVKLSAIDVQGQPQSVRHDVEISTGEIPPKSDFTPPQYPLKIGQPVRLLAESSGTITKWTWNLGDGTVLLGPAIEHAYSTSGVFVIELVVEGPLGRDSMKKTITVAVAELAFSTDTAQPTRGGLVTLTNESTEDYTAWRWDFGDGSTSNQKDPGTHSYARPGVVVIKVTARGPDGKDHQLEKTLTVVDIPPIAKFTLPIDNLDESSRFRLSGESSGTVDSWVWEMGDGTTYQTKEIQHAYAASGEFTIKLTVSNISKHTNSVSQILRVIGLEPVVIGFGLVQGVVSKGRAPVEVSIDNQCTGSIQRYRWDFGDGTTTDDIEPLHVYHEAGDYEITLTVWDHKGREYASTGGQSILMKILPPPIISRQTLIIACVILYCTMIIILKYQPFHKREFRYQIDSDPKKTYSDPKKGKRFLWQEDKLLSKGSAGFTDGFEVVMKLGWFFNKKYYFKLLKGKCVAQRANGTKLRNDLLCRNAEVKIGRDQFTQVLFTRFTMDVWKGRALHATIAGFFILLYFSLAHVLY